MTHQPVGDGPAVDRRSVLKAVGLGVVGTTMLAGTAGATGSGSDRLARQLAEVRTGTRKYRSVARAREDGYDAEVSPYVPNMGFHFANPALIVADSTTVVDRAEPPILVYHTTGGYAPAPGEAHHPSRDGDLRLGAVEFAHGETGVPGDVFSDETASRSLSVAEAEGWGPVPGTPLSALHVWVHRGNPAGVFNPTNPTID